MKTSTLSLRGIIPPIATPLDSRERVDEPGLRRLVDYLLRAGVHGVFVMGSTGEFAFLTEEERQRGVHIVVDQVASRVPVLVGCGAESTRKAIANAAVAAQAGAQALVLMPTYYLPATQTEIVAHFRRFVDATDLPCVVYNIPLCTVTSITPETAALLFDMPRVIGMKDSSDDFWLFQRLLALRRKRKNIVLFQGSENNLAASLLLGADGGVLGIANVLPSFCVQMYQAASQGKVERVRALNEKLHRVRRTYTLAPPRQVLKYMLELKGLCSGRVAEPNPGPLPQSIKREISRVLRDEGFLD